MMIIGVDYHPSFQAIALFVEETAECGEQELNHSDGQAEKFYRDLKQRGISVRVGMEATGRGDQNQTREEAEDRPQGCPTPAQADAGR
jgi:hypothetical protein